MQYTLELDSVDYDVLQEAVTSAAVRAAAGHAKIAREMGRGSQSAIFAGHRLKALNRVEMAVKMARSTGMIPHAIPTGEPPASLQVGEDMALVYGRPRPVKTGERK